MFASQAAMKCAGPRTGVLEPPREPWGVPDRSLHSLAHNNLYCQKPDLEQSDPAHDPTSAKRTQHLDTTLQVGMPTLLPEHPTEAIKKYCAAFPALKKDHQFPLQYLLPPPEWCRKSGRQSRIMQVEASLDNRTDRSVTIRERRHSHRVPKKSRGSKKRCFSYTYSKRSEAKENFPEWMTHEGAWDVESQDPVREFIKALALDVGPSAHRTMIADEVAVPDWSDVRLLGEWALGDARADSLADDDSYARFEAKFDSSIEALWAGERQGTPESPLEWRYSPVCDTIWTARQSVDTLHDRLEPLRLADEPTSLYSYEDVYDEMPSVASTMRSLTALNHSKSSSSFVEVMPRRASGLRPAAALRVPAPGGRPPDPEEDLLTSARTHFRPIRERSLDASAPPPPVRYTDGAEFEVSAELDAVSYKRSESGFIYAETEGGEVERYLDYRGEDAAGAALGLPFSLKLRVRQTDKSVQTEEWREESREVREACDECSRLFGAKKMRPQVALDSIWSADGGAGWCGACAAREAPAGVSRPPLAEECEQDWEELLSDIGRAHARYAAEASGGGGGGGGEWWRADRKRRHSAAVWCAHGGRCARPHDAPFLHCCAAERPLTR